MLRTASRTASTAIVKQSEGVQGAMIGMGLSPLRPNIACSKSDCFRFGGQSGAGAAALYVDDDHRQFQHQRQIHGLALERDPWPRWFR